MRHQPLELPGLRFVSRDEWGADESRRFGPDGEILPAAYFPVQVITLHHTGTSNDVPDAAAAVRSIYRRHTKLLGLGDIGFHILIAPDGLVFQGRWTDSGSCPVFGGRPDGILRAVTAAHVTGSNAGNVGVALLGELTAAMPTAAACASLTTFLACAIPGPGR